MEFTETFAAALGRVPAEFFDRSRFVPGTGTLDAEVMLIGEAPGADEVEQGEPFVGRAGQVLDDALAELGVDRTDLYITNVVKVRPPDNRDPTADEIAAWEPVLRAEIERVDPDTLVPMGNFAARHLLDTSDGITELHGKVFTRDGRRIVPAFHPAATLYDRSKTPDFVDDLRAAFGTARPGQKTLDDL